MNKKAKTKDSLSLPEPKIFQQKLPAGVSTLIGEVAPPEENAPPKEPLVEVGKEKKEPLPRGRKAQELKRVTASIRFREDYLEHLDRLYLTEKLKRRKLTKSEFIEEAFELLFQKYEG